ncbi:MAG: twin-arginine translocation signal domain-containing protein [Dehalococcoidia bacterium]
MSKINTTNESRRSFLSKIGIGTAVIAIGSSPILNWIRKESVHTTNHYEDSIFTPKNPKV